MNHQPFEDWLLADAPLTPDQRRDLQSHLRTCKTCAVYAEVNMALRMAQPVRPAEGFGMRFQARLAVRKAEQRRRTVFGVMLLALTGLGILVWVASPVLSVALDSPSDFFFSWITTLVQFFTGLQALGKAGMIFLEMIPSLVPLYVWMFAGSLLAGMGLLWSFTFWKSSMLTQKA